MTDLTVCDLTQHHILNWMAILLENRTFDLSAGMASAARDYMLQNFLPEYRNFDIIRGYRADDSYFSFARDFLNNSLSLEELAEAMKLGELGEQEIQLHEQVGEYAASCGIDACVCVGTLSRNMVEKAKAVNPDFEVIYEPDLEGLLKNLKDYVKKGDTILVKASHFMDFPQVVKALREL